MNEGTAGKPATGEKQAPSDRAERSEGRESAGKPVLGALDPLTDGELDAVVKRCGEILAAREKERRDKALQEIQKIAREHGLNVNVKETAVRRRKAAKTKK